MDSPDVTIAGHVDPASFRDPSGFVFRTDNGLFRQVNHRYAEAYDRLEGSGLYRELVSKGLLISHEELPVEGYALTPEAYRVLRPETVPFLSYPYEWCFSQLKDAALATLDIQERAIGHGMSLKDASAYNIQFLDGRPVLIDTLSFEIYEEGRPWIAYRQFCQHFLGPLLLMSHVDVRLSGLLTGHIDGIPLDLATHILPRRTMLRPGTLLHMHLHARSLSRHSAPASKRKLGRVSKAGLLGIIDSLRGTVKGLRWRPRFSEWLTYETSNTYSESARKEKQRAVSDFLRNAVLPTGAAVWDLGANTGEYSRIAAEFATYVVALDSDPAAVESNYLRCKADQQTKILPLVQDLTNPSGALGWAGVERRGLGQRGKPDALIALALIHHLAISNNVPLNRIARYLASLAPILVIEFVPKTDPQVANMLSTREDIFSDYDRAGFEATFDQHFRTLATRQVPETERRLYLMRRRDPVIE